MGNLGLICREVLAAGGNAVDAAIAVMLCMGVTIPESMGLGGGCMFVLYNGKEFEFLSDSLKLLELKFKLH